MHKRPLPKLVVSVDPATLKYAPVENSIVYTLRHVIPYPPLKLKPYVPIMLVEQFLLEMVVDVFIAQHLPHQLTT